MAEKTPEYLMSKEECLKIGGHCYEVSPMVVLTYPPIYHRTCKHCGHTQQGQPQSDIGWEDEPEEARK